MKSKLNWNTYKRSAPEWFRDAKFGLFIHWGPYSVPAYENEWYSRNMYEKGLPQNIHHINTYGSLSDFGYKEFFPMFTGERFDPSQWADLVVRSGARYAGPVTEHADNFSMWNSQVNPINSVNYGPGRDVTGECVKAFRERGIKILSTFHHQWLWGWFMSTDTEADVYDPANAVYYWDALPLETNRYQPNRHPDSKFNTMWLNKVKEVVDQYQPDMIYFDSRSNIIDEVFRYDMVKHYYETSASQEVIISYKQEDFPTDIGIYDIECGRFSSAKDYPWQTDDRLEDNITWCIVQEPRYKSAKHIIHQLCDVVSKNGNLLLGVGPRADGSFHKDAIKELYAVGDWLKINGEAIYGTRPYRITDEGPTAVNDADYNVAAINEQLEKGLAVDVRSAAFTALDYRFTAKNDAIYAIALGWPKDNILKIHSLKKGELLHEINEIRLLGCTQTLAFNHNEEELIVYLPAEKPCEYAYCLCIRSTP